MWRGSRKVDVGGVVDALKWREQEVRFDGTEDGSSNRAVQVRETLNTEKRG